MERLPFTKPYMDEEMAQAAKETLLNERLVMGESVHKFEEEFARYIGSKRAVSLSSGTNALQLAMVALGVKDREVVTTPFSFIASASSIIQANGVPRFADVSLEDYNIDPKLVKRSIGSKTIAIMPVHIFGHPCKMKAIMEIAEEKDHVVVEDACQAHGASVSGKRVGSFGDAGCFSFYPTKNMSVGGDGGMVTTDDEDLARKVEKLRDCGRSSKYLHDAIGYTSRLNTSNAAIGRLQLRHLEAWNERRRAIAKMYHESLRDIEGISLPPRPSKGIEPVYHLYAIRCKDRKGLFEHLASKGIDCAVHYPTPIHLQPAIQQIYGYKEGAFPESETLSKEILSIPMFPAMKDDDVSRVVDEIEGFALSNKRR